MRRPAVIISALVIILLVVGTTIHAQRGGPNGRAGLPPQGNGVPPAGVVPQGRGGPGGPDNTGPNRPGPRGSGGPLALPGVTLTEDQRDKIQDIVRGGRDQSAGISDELQLARRSLHRELFADARNSGRINELTTKVATLEKQLLDIHVKTQTSVADVLTTEQRQSVRASGAARPGGPAGGGRRGGGARPGRG